ncbi:glutamyl-tRNA amidotransferase [candidate division WOR-1 bacterium DG_54_3]|uniref:Aspartyl/glutamyl-tRNA(Asn/Gln) amidotransferase subunit C n=1 Tax=candidate division WOR-1 bacterium DG_54_3 TaxID=1703775 RepID=A0A0S7Y1N4_UNCSA|nr:MAG: glutamyl-tRNA amidotransferase [candidate division WOR-1 bacterium DG_54_3]
MNIDVEHIARLARLGLSEKEKELFAKQLSAILEYADILKKLDTEDVPPASHAIPLKNVLREDKVVPCENTGDILANAPAEEQGMFRVPRIIE